MFYNPTRKHTRNGMQSPIEFERQHEAKPNASEKLGTAHTSAGEGMSWASRTRALEGS